MCVNIMHIRAEDVYAIIVQTVWNVVISAMARWNLDVSIAMNARDMTHLSLVLINIKRHVIHLKRQERICDHTQKKREDNFM